MGIAIGSGPGAEEDRVKVAADLATLRVRYQEARKEIEAFGSGTEREIGLATLRLEAEHTLNQLRTTGPGLTEDDLAPLTTYVSGLRGGEEAEAAVAKIDQTANTVLHDLGQSLSTMTLMGSISTVVGFLTLLVNTSVEAGAAAAGAVLVNGTALVALMKIGAGVITAVERTSGATWSWASSLGSHTDQAMAGPREVERRLWARSAGVPWRYEALASKARLRAQLIVGFFWAAVIFAGGAFAWGFGRALIEFFSRPVWTQTGLLGPL